MTIQSACSRIPSVSSPSIDRGNGMDTRYVLRTVRPLLDKDIPCWARFIRRWPHVDGNDSLSGQDAYRRSELGPVKAGPDWGRWNEPMIQYGRPREKRSAVGRSYGSTFTFTAGVCLDTLLVETEQSVDSGHQGRSRQPSKALEIPPGSRGHRESTMLHDTERAGIGGDQQ